MTRGNVLMVVHSYCPADPRVRREAEALVEAGYGVDVLCLRDVGQAARETVGGVHYLRFPLHPLGYAMAAAFSSQIWGGFFAVWLVKGAILRFGGVRMYKRLTPMFIGLALGHFFTMGIAWAAIGSYFGQAAERARVWFT